MRERGKGGVDKMGEKGKESKEGGGRKGSSRREQGEENRGGREMEAGSQLLYTSMYIPTRTRLTACARVKRNSRMR